MNADQLEYAAWWAKDNATSVSLTSPDHGPRHWRDVARIAHAIIRADESDRYDPVVAFLFAALHDTQRENEYRDPKHGERAAGLARHMKRQGILPLDDEQFKVLNLALENHDSGTLGVQDTIGLCFDADRLTLPRVGITPKLKFMSTGIVRRDFSLARTMADTIINGDDLQMDEIIAIYEGRADEPARTIPT